MTFIPPPPPNPAWEEWLEKLTAFKVALPAVRTVHVSQAIFDLACAKAQPAEPSPFPYYGQSNWIQVDPRLGRDQWYAMEGQRIVSINGQELTNPIDTALPSLLENFRLFASEQAEAKAED